jgi:hypothetical protein
MSSAVLRRLAISYRTNASIYHGRGFATSSSLFADTSSNTDSVASFDSPLTVTLIPG